MQQEIAMTGRRFVDIDTAQGYVGKCDLGSSGSDIACVRIHDNEEMLFKTFTPSTRRFIEVHPGAGQFFTAIDRLDMLTVFLTTSQSNSLSWSSLTLIQEDKILSRTEVAGKFYDYKGRMALGNSDRREGIVAIFDITGRSKVTALSEHKIKPHGDWWDFFLLSLSDNSAIVSGFDSAYLIDARVSDIVKLELHRSLSRTQGVIAGCSAFFFCSTLRLQPDSPDKIIVFAPVKCAGIMSGSAWLIAVNPRYRGNIGIVSIFAWHPAHGALAVVVQASGEPYPYCYHVLLINPRTLTYIDIQPEVSNASPYFLPGHICGQPVVMKITALQGQPSVMV